VYAHLQTEKFGRMWSKESVTLWCNGAKQIRNDTDSDEDVLPPSRKKNKRLIALDEKNRRVEKLASSL